MRASARRLFTSSNRKLKAIEDVSGLKLFVVTFHSDKRNGGGMMEKVWVMATKEDAES